MPYVRPGETFDATAQDAPTGLAGTIGVQVLDTPGNNVVTPRTTAGISEAPPGSGIYSITLTAPTEAGSYLVVWDTGGATPAYTSEELTVTYDLAPFSPTPGLILPLAEFKALAGIIDTSQDTKINALLPLVDDAIRQYTERDFGDPDVTESRDFKWDGRGAVEIDDVKDVTSVLVNGSAFVANTQYVLGPDRDTRQYWLELPPARPTQDTAMGFTYNLDVYGSLYPRTFPVTVSVLGTFGYPSDEIPGSVKMAAFLALSSAVDSPSEGNLQSEAIDTYARSWDTGAGQLNQGLPQEFLPARALTLLDPFVRRTGSA